MMKNKALLMLLAAAAFGLSACSGSGGKIQQGEFHSAAAELGREEFGAIFLSAVQTDL